VAVGVVALVGQTMVTAAGDDPAGVSVAVETPATVVETPADLPPERSGSRQGPVTADAAAGGAALLQTPLLAVVTPPPPPPPPAPDRSPDRASRDGDRAGSSGSGSSGSAGSGSSGSGSSGSGSSGSGSSGSTRPPAPGGGGSTSSQVVSLVNAARADAGCGPVAANGALTAAAQAHSADMAANDYFSHTSQDGRSFADRIRAAGYGGGAMAENIAAGQSSAAAVMAGWMDSSGHRANILNCSYRHIGVGLATGGSFGTYWTQTFGG
jgi:uncharacterized protein YkwD